MNRRAALAAALVLAAIPPAASAQAAPAPPAPAAKLVQLEPPPAAASGASGSIDPEAATRAYLSRQTSAQKARSDAYFEGGYWMDLWTFLWAVAVYFVLLHTGSSARMRNFAERLTGIRHLQVSAYWVQFLLATTVMTLPLTVYRDYVREHAYGLSNLTLSAWFGELGKALALSIVLGGAALAILYAVVRRLPRTWWIWGSVTAVAFLAFFILIVPVAIVPVFNSPKKLADQRVVAPILSLARANGIGAHDVWEVDASKQTKRISANVSGLFGTERITLNDNLLARASLPEIQAVMGHEMGHYVLNHIPKLLMELGLVIVIGFALVKTLFERLQVRHPRWQVRGIDDVAGLPLAALLLMAYLTVLTPVLNSIIRVQEYEADLYALNASAQPDGFAQVALKLGEYRKLAPGPIEEWIFFDHPSGRTRIYTAMRWKAEHPETWSATAEARKPASQ
ncbi:MAG TPA: M48 family metallopeptidase [Myxococcales bacterium]|nr:M48 family metallopeptidase [Myxococcales bacterium]